MTEQQRGSFKAKLSSNGSLPGAYCGYMENVRFCYNSLRATSERLLLSQRALGKVSSGSFIVACFWLELILR